MDIKEIKPADMRYYRGQMQDVADILVSDYMEGREILSFAQDKFPVFYKVFVEYAWEKCVFFEDAGGNHQYSAWWVENHPSKVLPYWYKLEVETRNEIEQQFYCSNRLTEKRSEHGIAVFEEAVSGSVIPLLFPVTIPQEVADAYKEHKANNQ